MSKYTKLDFDDGEGLYAIGQNNIKCEKFTFCN